MTTQPPFPREGYVLGICGDYIGECIFPEVLSRHFAFFFRSVENIKQFDPQLFKDVFHIRERCKLTVRRSGKAARELSQKIMAQFKS
jgi:hypothetical protein